MECVASVKSLPALNHSVVYIFFPFGIPPPPIGCATIYEVCSASELIFWQNYIPNLYHLSPMKIILCTVHLLICEMVPSLPCHQSITSSSVYSAEHKVKMNNLEKWFLPQLILIWFHTNVGYDNIWSKFDFHGPGLKVKFIVAIFRKTLS